MTNQKRLQALEDDAKQTFLERSDYQAIDWLGDEAKTEYLTLFKKVDGYCLLCGEDDAECECDYTNL